jgi:hypothetical protein
MTNGKRRVNARLDAVHPTMMDATALSIGALD